jgi:hypothetical protein
LIATRRGLVAGDRKGRGEKQESHVQIAHAIRPEQVSFQGNVCVPALGRR